MTEDQRIEEALRGLYGAVDTRGVWAAVQARTGTIPAPMVPAGGASAGRASNRHTRPGRMQTALTAAAAVLLIGAVAVGAIVGVRHLESSGPVLVIGGSESSEVTAVTSTVSTESIMTGPLFLTQDQVDTVTSGPVALRNESGQEWQITADQLHSCMGLVETVPSYAGPGRVGIIKDAVTALLKDIASQVAVDPVNATFASDGTKAWVVVAVPGETMDLDKTGAAVLVAALRPSDRIAQIVMTAVPAGLTTEAAQAMGVNGLLASYTTEPYAGPQTRQSNVRVTTQYASGKLLAPGEEYDFDETIGPRTAERGYKTDPGIEGDAGVDDVLGGGIGQVATTLFNAAFEAGLQILERHNGSLYVAHYPDGRDAAVDGTVTKNLRFRNDTEHYLWIQGTSDGVTTTFSIYGTDDGRTVKSVFSGWSYGAARTQATIDDPSLGPGVTTVVVSGQSGRSCSVTRTVTYSDGTEHTDTFYSVYPMIPETIEAGPTTTTSGR